MIAYRMRLEWGFSVDFGGGMKPPLFIWLVWECHNDAYA